MNEEEIDDQEQVDDGGAKAASNRKRNSGRKVIGNLWDNIKGAVKGNVKDIYVLKIKAIIFVVIAVLVFFALIVEAVAEDTSDKSKNAAVSTFSESTSEAAELFNSTGSLILATDDELEEIKTSFFDSIENSNEAYYNALNTKYKDKASSTVANRVAHITTNFESEETEEVEIIDSKVKKAGKEVLPSDNRTIYDHILRTEKYNFNNIVWRSFVKNGTGVKEATISYTVDSDTGLKYPAIDTASIDGDTYTLEFFINKMRPYLQTWYIPFDIMIGTEDAQSGGNLNTDLAYEIITSAYHEIVSDRYKLEELERTTNYLVYDKTTTTKTTTRSCAWYKVDTTTVVDRKAGTACTKEDYFNGLCKDAVNTYQGVRGTVYCFDRPANSAAPLHENWEKDVPDKCSYGVLKKDITAEEEVKQYICTDTVTETKSEEKDVRETKTKPNDNKQYRWSYVVSSAKLFDRVLTNEYTLKPYYEYSLTNYNNFIAKKDTYKNMSVEDFKESEQTNSKSDIFKHEEKDYYDKKTDVSNDTWAKSESYLKSSIPSGAILIKGTKTSKVVSKTVITEKEGKEYTDTYNWYDELEYGESKAGIYNMDSVNDVTGSDGTPLDGNETSYYEKIYNGQELNLIDLMNSDNKLYENYISKNDASSDNIGIRRGALDISYNVLKADLKDQLETYNTTGLIYGNSLGISSSGSSMLSSLDLSSIVAAGNVNELVSAIAESFTGHKLSTFRSPSFEDYDTFPWSTHWCAMFASYCVKRASVELGMSDCPIPWFASCSEFWRQNIRDGKNVGFYDVDTGKTSAKTSVSTAIAPLEAIQPGDILLFTWPGDPVRSHAAIAKSVEKDANGKVTKIVSIDGNLGGGANYNASMVKEVSNTWTSSSRSLYYITSFVSVSTVFANASGGVTP